MPNDTVPMKQYVDALLRERDKRHVQRDRFIQRAIDKALVSMNKRLDLLNELRGNVATKDQLDALAVIVADLKTMLTSSSGISTGKAQSWTFVVSVAIVTGVIFGVIGFVIAHSGVKP